MVLLFWVIDCFNNFKAKCSFISFIAFKWHKSIYSNINLYSKSRIVITFIFLINKTFINFFAYSIKFNFTEIFLFFLFLFKRNSKCGRIFLFDSNLTIKYKLLKIIIFTLCIGYILYSTGSKIELRKKSFCSATFWSSSFCPT